MKKFSIVIFFIFACMVFEILACKKCTEDSSSSSEECPCKKRKKCEDSNETESPLPTPSTTTESPITCEKSSIDLVFVVDASGSIGIDNFNIILAALSSTVQNISVGPYDNQSHIGLTTFDNIAIKQFGFLDHLTTPDVQLAISQVPYAGYGTFIEVGMTTAIDQIFDQPGNRPNSSDIMIVITDGHDKSNVSGAQQLAASKNITVFSVGVGPDVFYEQLVTVSGSSSRTFNITTFDFLGDALKTVCHRLADNSNSIPEFDKPASDSVIPNVVQQYGLCNFDTVHQQISSITKPEFCRGRPYCDAIC